MTWWADSAATRSEPSGPELQSLAPRRQQAHPHPPPIQHIARGRERRKPSTAGRAASTTRGLALIAPPTPPPTSDSEAVPGRPMCGAGPIIPRPVCVAAAPATTPRPRPSGPRSPDASPSRRHGSSPGSSPRPSRRSLATHSPSHHPHAPRFRRPPPTFSPELPTHSLRLAPARPHPHPPPHTS
ncbi:extensin-like [Penaeus chinensis]|uniref:extensin-like n=1 Tax=Penaeus chinensis TaxID=139456 RepID=UPI001FB822A6|nr:extensin-like [Penaeus chinensis]